MIVLILARVLVLGLLVTASSIVIVRRLIPHDVTGWEKNSSSVFAFAGTLYALVIGFVLAFALQGYQETSANAGDEANSVRALSRAANDRLFQTFGRLGRTNAGNAALSGSLDRVRELGQARAARLQASSEDLPLIFWLFLIGEGLIICVFSAIVTGLERSLMQFVYILPVALLLISSIYLVYAFEQPYSGTNAIEPTSMEIALDSVVEFVPDPRANRPCP
jgi:hypothetical protein